MWLFVICALIALLVLFTYSGGFMHGDNVEDL